MTLKCAAALLVLAIGACRGPQQPEVAALTPVPSSEDRGGPAGWGAGNTWMDQHEDINRIARGGGIELVLLGDSITQSWGGPGRSVGSPAADIRRAAFEPWAVGNFGISGDRTQHLLWRIEHGNFEHIEPRAIMLLIGTNNLGAGDPQEEVAAGIEAINRRIAALDALPNVRYLDLSSAFLEPDGRARAELYAGDYLHLSLAGYELWGARVVPVLQELIGH